MPFSPATNALLDDYLTAKTRYEQAKAAHEAGAIVKAITVVVTPKDPSNPTHVQLAAFSQNNIADVLPELSGRVVDHLRRLARDASEALDAAIAAERS
jgi:hypothetical protein